MQGRHSPTCVLPRNCTNSLLQQGPGILPISPTQKWVNKSMPVAKSSDWWLLLLPRTHVLSSSCPQDHEHSLKKDRPQTPLCHVPDPGAQEVCLPGKASLLAEGRLCSSILPTTQVCASPGQQDFYFHNLVIISAQNCEQRRWRGRGGRRA